MFLVNFFTGSSSTQEYTERSNSPAPVPSSNDDDNLACDRIAEEVSAVKKEISEAGIPTPERLGEILEVFRNALAHQELQTTAEEDLEIVELFTKRSVIEYTSQANQFSKLYSESFKVAAACNQEVSAARELLATSVNNTEDNGNLSSAKLAQLSATALDNIKKADEARKKFTENSTHAEQFYSSLMSLEIRLLVHPWKQRPTFNNALLEITKLKDQYRLVKSTCGSSNSSSSPAPSVTQASTSTLQAVSAKPKTTTTSTTTVSAATSSSTPQINTRPQTSNAQNPPSIDVRTLNTRALCAISEKDYQKAFDLLNSITQENIGFWDNRQRFELLAKACQRLGKYDDACRIAREGLRIVEEHALRNFEPATCGKLYLELVKALINKGQAQEALASAAIGLKKLTQHESFEDLKLAQIRATCVVNGYPQEIVDVLGAEYDSKTKLKPAFIKCCKELTEAGRDVTWLENIRPALTEVFNGYAESYANSLRG